MLQVRNIKQPVLLVWGKQDEVLDPKYVQEFERDIPHMQTLILDACGHVAHLEQSRALAGAIHEFVMCKQPSVAQAQSAALSGK
jgi:pimeloyl-ACP methyl ester carboxylesterase